MLILNNCTKNVKKHTCVMFLKKSFQFIDDLIDVLLGGCFRGGNNNVEDNRQCLTFSYCVIFEYIGYCI
ncbi:hypothetical protein PPBDW_II1435 [Photobacterium kishitanii]|nr:hypothetical protein PPBDW_II1435 [Photobacterium kishitanii]